MQVRAATARLLHAVSGVRTLSARLFDGIVTVDAVLARLVLDDLNDAVAGPLTAILVPSFFPPGARNSEVRMRSSGGYAVVHAGSGCALTKSCAAD